MSKARKNVFKNQLKPKAIKIDLPADKSYQEEFAQGLGFLPLVWYNGAQVEWNHISGMSIDYINNVPSLSISFKDTFGLMKESGIPLDDTRISIFIYSRNDQVESIHMDFKVIDFSENNELYSIVGILDAKELYLKRFKSYPSMTSFELLQSVAKDAGLGFNSNIDNTSDKMTWINPGNRTITFIKDSLPHTYKSDNTFLYHYVDFYYHMNYIDIEKEIQRDITNELGLNTSGMEQIIKTTEPAVLSKLLLTNDFALKQSNFYFETCTIINNSTKISLNMGYMTKVEYYDELEKSFLAFDIDPITSDATKTIILRGAPQDNKIIKENVDYKYMGPLDMDNVHKNYHYGIIQNQVNLAEMDKIQLIIELPTPNFNIYRFQKIYVFFSNQKTTMARNHVNYRLTGEWLITKISYSFMGMKLRQTVNLTKRHLELSPEEIENESGQTVKPTPEPRTDKNENPIDKELPL